MLKTFFSKRKNILVSLFALIVIWTAWHFLAGASSEKSNSITVEVKKGEFEIPVTTTGELQAKNSENILGPTGLRSIGVFQVKITDLVPEGTVVGEGDYIATLDRAEVTGKIKDLESELQKSESEFTKIKLDTTLDLRTARDELINLKSTVEEKKLTLEQSKYEPPATIRQAELEKDKAQRGLEQAQKNYTVKYEQACAKMREVSATLSQHQRKYDDMVATLDKFIIKAPKGGMVIYIRDWDGKKRIVGSTISPWDPSVATLPDLSVMISKTYVNEVDISKIKAGQTVEIGIDAFPAKKFSGKVVEVANVGEQLPGGNSKVFEVKVQLIGSDTLMRPAMTTVNKIMTSKLKDVLHIPLECVHSKDSISYVFLKQGFGTVKKQVKLGVANDSESIVEQGLSEGDVIFLSRPEEDDKSEFVRL